jgi:hypothetical protein
MKMMSILVKVGLLARSVPQTLIPVPLSVTSGNASRCHWQEPPQSLGTSCPSHELGGEGKWGEARW